MTPENPHNHKRKQKLVKPGLQLRLVGSFAGMAALAMMLQFLLFGYLMMQAATGIEGNGGRLAAEVPGALLSVMGLSVVILLPLFVLVGVMLTFRIAGPVYRFERYLLGLARGEETQPCKIRSGDHLQSLCDAINVATEPLRAATTSVPASAVTESSGDDSRAAA